MKKVLTIIKAYFPEIVFKCYLDLETNYLHTYLYALQ